jgi:hypothetical protein
MEAQSVATKTRKSKDRPEFSAYTRLEGESLVQRIAHFLNWCAENRPKEFIPYNQVAQSINGYSRMPRLQSEEVVLVQKSMSRVRPVLITKFKRTLTSTPGIGVRATVDDADIVTTELAKNVRRIERDSERVAQLFNLVDPEKLPNTLEFKPWKEWFNRQIGGGGLFKMITSPDWAKRCALPPAPDIEKK